MAKRKPHIAESYLSGMVHCLVCGSRSVRGYERYSLKRRDVVAVEYICPCGNRAVVGSLELTVPYWRDVDLRSAGYALRPSRDSS